MRRHSERDPAVWTRASGETVFPMSPYGARGIEGDETPEGDALLAQLWEGINRTI